MGGKKTNAAPRSDDALPDLSGEDEFASEPTKIGDGRLALEEAVRASLGGTIPPKASPHENATSKMAPFQLEEVLERLAETPPERSQARMKAPSTPPPDLGSVVEPVAERETVPQSLPAPLPPPAPQETGGGASAITAMIAVIFVALVCAVLLAR